MPDELDLVPVISVTVAPVVGTAPPACTATLNALACTLYVIDDVVGETDATVAIVFTARGNIDAVQMVVDDIGAPLAEFAGQGKVEAVLTYSISANLVQDDPDNGDGPSGPSGP